MKVSLGTAARAVRSYSQVFAVESVRSVAIQKFRLQVDTLCNVLDPRAPMTWDVRDNSFPSWAPDRTVRHSVVADVAVRCRTAASRTLQQTVDSAPVCWSEGSVDRRLQSEGLVRRRPGT